LIKTIVVVVTIIVVIALVAFVVLAVTGRLNIVIKSSQETVIVQTKVCNNDVVQAYNEIYHQYGIGVPGAFDEVVNGFKTDQNWQQDPVCLYIAI
jgi:hypothetical protein